MLGGAPQRVMASIGGGDVSRDGRLACFRLENERIQLVTSTLEGSDVQLVSRLSKPGITGIRAGPPTTSGSRSRQGTVSDGTSTTLLSAVAPRRSISRTTTDSSRVWRGFLTAAGSCMPRAAEALSRTLAPLALWEVLLDGRRPTRQLTPAEASYQQPDLNASGLLSAARLQTRFDIWRYPFGGLTADSPERGQRVTHQTGQVLTPTAAPDGDQIAYLSDSGGHSNIWVDVKRRGRHGRSPSKRSLGGDRRPDLVAGRTVDCVRVQQGERRDSLSVSGWSDRMAAI